MYRVGFLQRRKLIESYSYGSSFPFWTFLFSYEVMSNTCSIFSQLYVSVLPSSCYKLHVYFRIFSHTIITQISSPKRNEKTNREKCETKTRKSIFGRQTRRVSAGTLHFTQYPNFSTVSQTYLSLLL